MSTLNVTRVNNHYLLKSEYYAAVKTLDPFQTATPCWHEKSFIAFNLRWFGDGSYDAGDQNGMPCEWTAFGDAAKGGN